MDYNCEKCFRAFPTRMGKGVHQACCREVREAFELKDNNGYYEDDDNLTIRLLHSDGTVENDEYDDYETFFLNPPNQIVTSVLTYLSLQENLFKSSYCIDALRHSTDIYDFIIRLPKLNEKDAVYNKLLKFSNKTKLSIESSRELMDVIRAFKPTISVPSDIRVTKNFLMKKCDFMLNNLMRKTVAWPTDWNISSYKQLGGIPAAVNIIALDPYEVLAYKLCDPVLQFLYKDHIKYRYFSTELADGTKCWSHFMSSEYAKCTEEEVKSYNNEAILIPLIVYSDGVALGQRNKVCH